MHPLLEESKRIKAQADRILRETGLVNILKEYGEVKIGGSYALDTMLRPDLDFFVITDKHDWAKLIKVQNTIMETKYFRELAFVNWIDFKEDVPDFMSGYYLQPWVPIDDQLWKMDLWLITPDQDKTEKLTGHFKKLLEQEVDDSKRIAILEIKEAMRQGTKYVKGVDGKLIYEAVLEKGVTNVDGFKEFLKMVK